MGLFSKLIPLLGTGQIGLFNNTNVSPSGRDVTAFFLSEVL